MDHLWTPWRYAYITGTEPKTMEEKRKGVPPELAAWPGDLHCIFCNMIAATDYAHANGMPLDIAEGASLIVYRGHNCFICLNRFPYASGHILILPYKHGASLAEIESDTAFELISLAQRAETLLRELYHPDGLNLGINIGRAAGAGIAEHMHMHVLPRWSGDSNFMTVTAETRILPELLDLTWRRLHDAFSATEPQQSVEV